MRLGEYIIDRLLTDDPTKTLHYQYGQLIQARNQLLQPLINLMTKILS